MTRWMRSRGMHCLPTAPPSTSAPGLGSPLSTSAPGLGLRLRSCRAGGHRVLIYSTVGGQRPSPSRRPHPAAGNAALCDTRRQTRCAAHLRCVCILYIYYNAAADALRCAPALRARARVFGVGTCACGARVLRVCMLRACVPMRVRTCAHMRIFAGLFVSMQCEEAQSFLFNRSQGGWSQTLSVRFPRASAAAVPPS